jgi:hypothetical protein
MQIAIQVQGLKEVQDSLKDFSERRKNAAMATALTRTAVKVRDKVKAVMPALLDRPTPYTMRQLKYVAATAAKPVAAVGFGVVGIEDAYGRVIRYQDLGAKETPAGKYLSTQIDGGARKAKRFEKALQAVRVLPQGWLAVPGQRAKMDAFGNQSVGEMRQILSYFDAAQMTAGSTQNMGAKGRAKKRAGTRKTAGFEYFAIQPGGTRSFTRANGKIGSHAAQPGIYRRTLFALGSRIEPIVIFVRAASYKRRFDFYNIAKAEGDRILQAELVRAIDESAARLRAKA